MNLKERAGLVDTVGSALSRGEHTLNVLPGLIRQLLEEEAWKEFETKLGKVVTYERFEDFVATPPLAGLGTSVELVERVVKDDVDTFMLLGKVLRRPHGGDRKSEKMEEKIKIDNINLDKAPNGTSKAYALQKLGDEGQLELLEQVKDNKLSPHAAMLKAGLRKPKIAVRLDNPESAAKTLLTHASPDFIAELKRLLDDADVVS